MKNSIVPIIVKKEGVSDDFYKVIEIYTKNGMKIEEGESILCFETSKTAIDIEAPTSGYIFYDVEEFDEIEIGQTIAAISDTESLPGDYFSSVNTSPKKSKTETISGGNSEIKISKPALRLIEEKNIDVTIAFAGQPMVTKQDVEDYISNLQSLEQISTEFNDKSVLIIGGGGHAKMCIDILKHNKQYEIVGIADAKSPINSVVLDIPVISRDDTKSISTLINNGLKNVILGVGAVLNHISRKKLYNSLRELQLFVPNIIHPSASIEPSASMGEGNQIMQGAIIGSDVVIGNNCIINSGAIVAHDSIIGDNVHLAPGAIVAGNVSVDNDTVIGMGSTLFLGVKIGKNVMINNGINIFNDIADNEIVR